MKHLCGALLCLPIACSLLPGQTPVKLDSTQKDGPSLLSGNEKNIRAYIELLRSDLKKSRTQVMSMVMQLDANEATKFWPIYKEFEAEYSQFGDQVIAVVRAYAAKYDEMTPEIANQLALKVLDLEQERTNMKRKYYTRFKEAIGAIAAMRFIQIENQIERILDLQIAAELPVIETPGKDQE